MITKFIIILTLVFLSFSNANANQNCGEEISTGKNEWFFRDKTDFQEDFEIDGMLSKYINNFNQALKKQNIELVVALLPTRGMLHSEFILKTGYNVDVAQKNYMGTIKKLQALGLNVAYMNDFYNYPNYFYKSDHHWSADGARAMAAEVAHNIKKLPIYSDLMKSEFETTKTEIITFEGSFKKMIEDKCSENLPKEEEAQIYKTFSKGGNNSLFDDINETEVVLIGTSNSDSNASKANFDGFLKEFLSVDVMNYSISGGGHDLLCFNI